MGLRNTTPPEPILMYSMEREGHIGVPLCWGVENYGEAEVDERTEGQPISVPKLPSPDHPRVSNPKAQKKFMKDVYNALLEKEYFIACASTGSGKTIVSLHATAKLGRTVIILVNTEALANQWVEEIKDKLGVPADRIGRVQQGVCEYEGKDFCVGLKQSVGKRKYKKEFYSHFGVVISDEVHRDGAELFSKSLSAFNAKYKIGLSATPDRKDGLAVVFKNYLGEVSVVSEATSVPCVVYVMAYEPTFAIVKNYARLVNNMSVDPQRNKLISRIIKKGYDNDRQILVVSDRIDQLYLLKEQCLELGIPEDKMGYFCTAYVTGEQKYVRNKYGKSEWVYERKKNKKEDLARVKEESQIILATYAMIKEGIDIPRLDFGVDATPKSEITQVIGRIRRPVPGKPMPFWYTIYDYVPEIEGRPRAANRLDGLFYARLRQYKKDGNIEVRGLKR